RRRSVSYWWSPASACSARPPRPVRLIPVCLACLLDHLIGQEQQGWGHRDPERLGGLEVEDQREPRRLLHRQVGGLGALEDLIHIGGGTPERVWHARAIEHEAAVVHVLAQLRQHRESALGRQL